LLASLARPEVETAVFGGAGGGRAETMPATPFLTFAVAVHRSAETLATSSYVGTSCPTPFAASS